jgi:hypothetical protein
MPPAHKAASTTLLTDWRAGLDDASCMSDAITNDKLSKLTVPASPRAQS